MHFNKSAFVFLFSIFLVLPHTVLSGEGVYQMRIPGQSWELELNFWGFKVLKEQAVTGGTGRMVQAMNEANGLALSVFIEKEKKPKSPEECRTFYWAQAQKSPIPKDEIQLYDFEQMRLVEWKVKSFRGTIINQKNIMAFLSKGEYCIDVHLSKANFQSVDQGLFEGFFSGVRILDQ